MEQLHFTVDGEFITDIVRQWYWYENKPYHICEELLFSCMVTDNSKEMQEFKRQTALDIIEGRKKFIGLNKFQLVDDGTKIRYITDKADEYRKKAEIEKIKEDIRVHAINYIDPYSTCKSLKEAKFHNVTTLEECILWFQYTENDRLHIMRGYSTYDECEQLPATKKRTNAGMWLTEEPYTVYKASEEGRISILSEDFWKNIYELKKDDPEFEERNNYYLASKRIKRENREYLDKLIEEYSKEIKDEPDFMTDEWFNYMFNHEVDKFTYYLKPDNYEHFEGLIDPNGNFYSCHFGGHNIKAFYLVIKNPGKFGIKTSGSALDNSLRINQELHIDAGNGLDFILTKGWCATRRLMGRSFVEFPTKGKLTKKQKDAIFDVAMKHNIKIDNFNEVIND